MYCNWCKFTELNKLEFMFLMRFAAALWPCLHVHIMFFNIPNHNASFIMTEIRSPRPGWEFLSCFCLRNLRSKEKPMSWYSGMSWWLAAVKIYVIEDGRKRETQFWCINMLFVLTSVCFKHVWLNFSNVAK